MKKHLKKSLTAAGFAAVVLLQNNAFAQGNLLVNGDFNTGDWTGWWAYAADSANQSAAIGTSYTFDSSPALSLTSASSTYAMEVGQNPAIGAGAAYNLSFDYSATATPSWGSAAVLIDYYNASSTYIGYEWIPLYDQTAAPNSDGQWLNYSGNFTTPANTASMQVEFDAWNWTTLNVDNVALQVATVPEPTSLALLGLAGCMGLVARRRR